MRNRSEFAGEARLPKQSARSAAEDLVGTENGARRAPLPHPVRPFVPGRRQARRLGRRDLEMLAWLARQRFATASQLAERFGIGVNVTARRLGQLAVAGHVDRLQPLAAAPSVYLATEAGIAVAGRDLPPARFDLRTYRHDLGLAALAVELELAGETTVTEREMRAREASGLASYAARFTPDPNGRSPRRHFADLAVERPEGQLEVYELELTAKRSRRLAAILRAYRRSLHIVRVVYLVDRPEVGRRVEELARSLHMAEAVEVRWW